MFKYLKNDFPAGVVVFLVALPLCLGIALASGVPLFSGIIAGVIGGIVVVLASNSQLGVSGPAAGLVVIVLTALQTLGSLQTLLLAIVMAGILQIVLGYLRAGIIAYYFPSSVIKGMLAAIGVLIIIKQIQHALGSTTADLSEFIETDNVFNLINPGAILIAIVSLVILILWEFSFIKKHRIFQLIQAPLVVVVTGILINKAYISGLLPFSLDNNQMVVLPVPPNATSFFNQFTFPDFSQLSNIHVYTVAVTLALVASLETLLCVEATDKLDPYKRVTSTNQELKAQGIGNILSGLIGGIPITQVIVRSSANIQSGGRTKAAALIHGVLLLLSVVLIPNILNMIPLASLAAILFVVGYKLTKPALYASLYKQGFKQFLPFIVTIVAIVLTDLLKGIAIGTSVSLFFILRNNYKIPYFFHKEKYNKDGHIVIRLSEDVSFLNKASILLTLNKLPENSKVIIDASQSQYIDPDVQEIINEFKEKARMKNIKLEILNFSPKNTPDYSSELIFLE
ncbi:MAG TPA: SulP family inorganic anion transporter [Bacteroidia bacterium]|nr:SulP family inorganic anion transporter [Bacteroidia bacterium]